MGADRSLGVENPQNQNPQNVIPNQIQVELGEREAEGIYSNVVFIAHSASEVILDFGRALPGLPKAKVYARVILTPQHAKLGDGSPKKRTGSITSRRSGTGTSPSPV